MTKIMTEETFDALRDKLAAAKETLDDEAIGIAREEIGAYCGTGTPADETEAMELGHDYVCALDDGRIVAWAGTCDGGRELTLVP